MLRLPGRVEPARLFLRRATGSLAHDDGRNLATTLALKDGGQDAAFPNVSVRRKNHPAVEITLVVRSSFRLPHGRNDWTCGSLKGVTAGGRRRRIVRCKPPLESKLSQQILGRWCRSAAATAIDARAIHTRGMYHETLARGYRFDKLVDYSVNIKVAGQNVCL
jgi:hypothetical protein